MRNREKLSEKLVRAAETRPWPWQIFDTEVLGLSICIYPSGSRSFMFDYRVVGRQRRFTIGRWPEWSVTAARGNTLTAGSLASTLTKLSTIPTMTRPRMRGGVEVRAPIVTQRGWLPARRGPRCCCWGGVVSTLT